MKGSPLLWLGGIVATIAVVAGTGSVTMLLAWERAIQSVSAQLRLVTKEVGRRSSATLEQEIAAGSRLKSFQASKPCSNEHLEQMRTAFSGAAYLQGIGVIRGNTLLCTTLTEPGRSFDLGEPDWTASAAVRSWFSVRLGESDTPFKIDARNGYAFLLVPNLVVDVLDAHSDVSVAQLATTTGKVQLLRHVGPYDFSGFLAAYGGSPGIFWQPDHLLLAHPAGPFGSVVLAAAPRATIRLAFLRQLRQLALPAAAAALLAALLSVLLIRRQTSMRARIVRALKRHEYQMHYQPVIDLRNGRCVGVEALIRWVTKDGRQVSPLEFIPVAERTGLIGRITKQVTELVSTDARRILSVQPDLHIAVNLSASDMNTSTTRSLLVDMVQRSGIPSRSVMLEVTESGVLYPEYAQDMLTAFHQEGYSVAIDDFGTGLSSLSQLARYRFDYLKIDKSFVDVICNDSPSSRVVVHIIELAKTLKLKIIAEGVETPDQHAMLARLGVEYAQGWLFAKAMRLDELLPFLAAMKAPDPEL